MLAEPGSTRTAPGRLLACVHDLAAEALERIVLRLVVAHHHHHLQNKMMWGGDASAVRTQSGWYTLPRPAGRRALAVPRPERRPPLHVRSAGCAAALWHSEGAAGPLGRRGGGNAHAAVVGRPAGTAGTAALGRLHAEWGADRLTWYVLRLLACTREPLLQVCCPARRCPARRRVLGATAAAIMAATLRVDEHGCSKFLHALAGWQGACIHAGLRPTAQRHRSFQPKLSVHCKRSGSPAARPSA